MKAILITSCVVALVLILSSRALGQDSYATAPIGSPPVMYHHSSTWEEGVLRGSGDVMRAAGEMNYNHSLATINYQEAYSRYLDNRLKAAATYFDLRQVNREARAEERGQRATPEALTEFSRVRAPDRLAAHQFDGAAHRLIWPASLEGDFFSQERGAIDRLIEARRGDGPENQEIVRLAEAMKLKLVSQVRVMKPAAYVPAKRFLTSLEYEMNFAPGPLAAVAAR
jgi:hypothetical protein